MISQILFLVILILLNAYFAATEIAFISLNDAKIEKMSKEGNKKAKQITKMLKNPSKFLATIHIGITWAGFLSSAFASDTFADILAPFLTQALPIFSVEVWRGISIVIITIIFLAALSRLLSAWVVMSIDILHGISVFMQFLFWMCPVMWQAGELPVGSSMPWIEKILKLNPLYYLAVLFRDAYLGTHTVSLAYGVYFWVVTIILFIFGSKVFKKFRPEFDDVL